MFGSFSKRRKRLIQEALKSGFTDYVKSTRPPKFSKHIVDAGLLIISKFPIIKSDRHYFSQGIYTDALSSKGALYAKTKITPNVFLHVFTTHMQASYASKSRKEYKFASVRGTQMAELADFIYSKISDGSDPAVLLGDLNVNKDTEEYKKLKAIFATKGLEFIDILHNTYGYHPITVNDIEITDGGVLPRDTVLTHPNEWKIPKSLDYILWITTRSKLPSLNLRLERLQSNKVVEEGDCEKEAAELAPKGLLNKSVLHSSGHKFDIESSIQRFDVKDKSWRQLSDHYGVSCTLAISKLQRAES